MNLARLEDELTLRIQDDSLVPYFRQWINDALLEIATDTNLPNLRLKVPVTLAIDNTHWVFDMPATFHKNLFQVYDSNDTKVRILDHVSQLDNMDIDHDDTGDHATHVVESEGSLYVYPMASETLRLWYYQLPTELVDPEDEPTWIPAAYRERVILSKVIVKNYSLIVDMAVESPPQSLIYWKEEYRSSLFGSPRGDIGMINYLALHHNKPRKHGGRNPLP